MDKKDLIAKIAEAIAAMEGFYITQEQAAAKKLRFPTRAQINANPGNIRRWMKDGVPYPTKLGYVDFVGWANGDVEKGLAEGWRILKILVSQYVNGQYTDGKAPSAYEMFAKYAPANDNNHPQRYAEFVAKKVGVDPSVPLKELIEA